MLMCSPVSGNVDLAHNIKQKSFLNARVLCAVLVASCDYTLAHVHGYLPRSECWREERDGVVSECVGVMCEGVRM